MRCFHWIGLLFAGLLCGTGCTAVIDKLSTNYYERNYSVRIPVEELNPKTQPEPSVQNTLMPHHGERVKMHVGAGWEVLLDRMTAPGKPDAHEGESRY